MSKNTKLFDFYILLINLKHSNYVQPNLYSLERLSLRYFTHHLIDFLYSMKTRSLSYCAIKNSWFKYNSFHLWRESFEWKEGQYTIKRVYLIFTFKGKDESSRKIDYLLYHTINNISLDKISYLIQFDILAICWSYFDYKNLILSLWRK